MTVKELLEKLQEFPMSAEVFIVNESLDKEDKIDYIEALKNEESGIRIIIWPHL